MNHPISCKRTSANTGKTILAPRDQMVSKSWAEASCSLGILLLLVVPNGAPASSCNTHVEELNKSSIIIVTLCVAQHHNTSSTFFSDSILLPPSSFCYLFNLHLLCPGLSDSEHLTIYVPLMYSFLITPIHVTSRKSLTIFISVTSSSSSFTSVLLS